MQLLRAVCSWLGRACRDADAVGWLGVGVEKTAGQKRAEKQTTKKIATWRGLAKDESMAIIK
jgi:hypothetical protein